MVGASCLQYWSAAWPREAFEGCEGSWRILGYESNPASEQDGARTSEAGLSRPKKPRALLRERSSTSNVPAPCLGGHNHHAHPEQTWTVPDPGRQPSRRCERPVFIIILDEALIALMRRVGRLEPPMLTTCLPGRPTQKLIRYLFVQVQRDGPQQELGVSVGETVAASS